MVTQTDEYKYLGLLFQRERGRRVQWAKAKARMLRNAQKASIWSWNLLMREGNPSVKELQRIYTGLVRPYLEYGAEVWGDLEDDWPEAEELQRKIARRILRVSKRTSNEVVLGELGWMTLKARRRMLQLFFWAKILEMPRTRWVKRVYQEARRRLQTHPNRVNWCSSTRDALDELGLGEHWVSQSVPPDWKELVRQKALEREERDWRERMDTKPKLDTY